MERYTVGRSPTRHFLMGVVGLVLLIAAADVMWLHSEDCSWCLAPAPETNEDGTLTTRGLADRRADILWGSAMLVTGAGLIVVAVAGLARRRSVVEIKEDGLTLAIAGTTRDPIVIPWSNVDFVRSGTDESDVWPRTRVLLVGVVDRSGLPPEPWSAAWEGSTLHVDAAGWDTSAADVAVRAGLALDWYRSRSRLEPPAG